MRKWRNFSLLFVAGLMTLTSCGGSGVTRTVLVDFGHDEFAGAFLSFFPNQLTVTQGATVDFRQVWNGEPHSVTMGTLVDDAMKVVKPLLEKYPGGQGAPPEAEQTFEKAFEHLPFMLDNSSGSDQVNQVAAQPCFLATGLPPDNPKKPCASRTQPAFNGKQAYYSSGFIHYAGAQGNRYKVKLADDIKPGTYNFYCDVHGPDMSGQIVVKPKGASVPSQAAVSKEARAQVDKEAAPALKALKTASQEPFDIIKAARAAGFIGPNDAPPPGAAGTYLAGYGTQESHQLFVSEFLPRTIHTKVGQKVTWTFAGQHTVSFGVPHYFPVLTVAKDGTVKVDPRGTKPVGGVGFPDKAPDPLPNPLLIDGGTWGGSGFRSSGFPTDTGDNQDELTQFSLTFTKAGTYDYACLVHPRMVGKVVVSA